MFLDYFYFVFFIFLFLFFYFYLIFILVDTTCFCTSLIPHHLVVFYFYYCSVHFQNMSSILWQHHHICLFWHNIRRHLGGYTMSYFIILHIIVGFLSIYVFLLVMFTGFILFMYFSISCLSQIKYLVIPVLLHVGSRFLNICLLLSMSTLNMILFYFILLELKCWIWWFYSMKVIWFF